jgi:hypothetical protein
MSNGDEMIVVVRQQYGEANSAKASKRTTSNGTFLARTHISRLRRTFGFAQLFLYLLQLLRGSRAVHLVRVAEQLVAKVQEQYLKQRATKWGDDA